MAVLLLALTAVSVPEAEALDILMRGRKLVAKSEPSAKRRRFVFRGQLASGEIFNPLGGATKLVVTEVDCDGDVADEPCVPTATSGEITLDPTLWTRLGEPTGSAGYRYTDPEGSRGGIRTVLLRSPNSIAVKAIGDNWPLVPTGNGNGVRVRVTHDVVPTHYCAEFGGIERRNLAGSLLYKRADAPVRCGGACGNGLIENGEGCDPPGSATCDASCRLTCTDNPNSTLIACSSSEYPTLDLAGAGDTFLLAYAQTAAEGSRARAVRFDSSGQSLDLSPLVLSDTVAAARQVLAVADDIGFYTVWLSNGLDYIQQRRVPFSGLGLGAIEVVATAGTSAGGTCEDFGGGPLGLGASLTNGEPHVSLAVENPCLGTWLGGVPGAGVAPFEPGYLDSAPASFARGDSAVAAVWTRTSWVTFSSNTFSIQANRMDPQPLPAPLQLTTLPQWPTSPPVVAAAGDLFLVVWTNATQVRGRRFRLPNTLLDTNGGFLIASTTTGTFGMPAATYDGSRFAVAWRDRTPADDELRAVHVGTDGQIIEAAPLLVASAEFISDLAIAAGTSATWAAFSTNEPSGAYAMRIAEVP